jgi:hypothetical protein
MKGLAIVLIMVFSGSVLAEGQYRLTGPGATECFKYLDQPTDGEVDRMFVSWAQGFVTYHLLNNDMPLTREEISNEFLKRNLNNFCSANPTKDFYEAVMDHIVIINTITSK